MTAPDVPVEELIGWRRTSITTRRDGDGHWYISAWEVRRPGDVMPDRHATRAEVDDLADWLADRGCPDVEFTYRGPGVVWMTARFHVLNERCNFDLYLPLNKALARSFPSRRAALEAAVRAIHEQENR